MAGSAPKIRLDGTSSSSPEEAAAIVAALQRFFADTMPALEAQPRDRDRWQEAALREAVDAKADLDAREAWINA